MDRSSWPCIEVQCNTSEELNEVLGCGLRTSISLTMGMFAPEGRLRAAALLLGDEGEVSPWCLSWKVPLFLAGIISDLRYA